MTLRETLRDGMGKLTGADVPSSEIAAEVLLLHTLSRTREWLYSHAEENISEGDHSAYQELLGRRAAGVPTQYLTGKQEFWGLEFEVNPSVLIPRPETEHVVEAVLDIVREKLQKPDVRGVSIVDVGTGSGCIALALAHELPEAEIHAVDISDDALAVARRNAERLGLADRVRFHKSDLLDVFLGGEVRFDIIVSNPPYVAESDVETLPREVRDHEPPTALFAGTDGLDVTRRLIEQSGQLLASAGRGFSPANNVPPFGGASAPEDGAPQRLKPEGGGSSDVRAKALTRQEEHATAPTGDASTGGGGPAPTGPQSEGGPAPTGPHSAGGPAPTGPQSEGGPAPTGPHSGGGPAPTGPQSAGGPAPTGPQSAGGPAPTGPQSAGGPVLRSLGAGGWLVLELGYNQAQRVCSLVNGSWTEVEITKDLRGIPRVLTARRE